MRSWRPALLLLLLSSITFFAGLGCPAITDADEAYYAEAAREMVETGDWLTPHFNYRDRWEKPVLYYWLTAATNRVTGVSEWAARFWSALAGIGLVFLSWSIARRMGPSGHVDASWLAGTIIATSFGYFYESRLALPDLLLAFFITLAIWAALRASVDPAEPANRTAWWIVAGLSLGLGLLTKGPVAVVVAAVVVVPIWWRESPQVVGLGRGVIVAGLAAALIGLPWYAAMWAEHGTAYLNSFFVGDNLERFTTSRFNARRIPGYYLAILLGGLLPWSAYLVACLPSFSRFRRLRRSMTPMEWRLVIWTAAPLVLFTVSVGQQPRYILPVLPPLAVLLARALGHRIEQAGGGQQPTALRAATWATAGLFAVMAGLLARAHPLFITAYPALTWIAVATLAAAAVLVARVAMTGRWSALPTTMIVCAAAVLLAVQCGVLSGRRPEPVEEMAAMVRAHRQADEPVASYEVFVRNLVFYTRFRHVELAVDPEAIGFVQSPGRVLLVAAADDVDRLQAASGVTLRTLATVRYLNTANIKIGMLLRPDTSTHVQTVLLVTNR